VSPAGTWALHPQLDVDAAFVADWPISRVLLMNDSNYPWLVLVPRLPGLRDLHDVPAGQQASFAGEINRASRALKRLFQALKINVAALGNAVPQLHVHVIARQTSDPAWPRPVWGAVPTSPYDPIQLGNTIAALQSALHTP
jgi:diadenosine tetraphosphate (Ap4A) HIT family hydrolase